MSATRNMSTNTITCTTHTTLGTVQDNTDITITFKVGLQTNTRHNQTSTDLDKSGNGRFIWKSADPGDPRNMDIELPNEDFGKQETNEYDQLKISTSGAKTGVIVFMHQSCKNIPYIFATGRQTTIK